MKIFEIENPSLIEKMLYFIGQNQSQTFSYETFLTALPVKSKETVMNYLSYLKESFLIGENLKLTKKALIKSKKYFLLDSGVLNMILKNRSILELKNIGLIMEGIIQRHALSSCGQINFFRDPKGREVDLVATYKTKLLPIESKYTDKIAPHDFKNLLYFMKKMNTEEGLIITKNLLDVRDEESKKIYMLPLWAFLLTV